MCRNIFLEGLLTVGIKTLTVKFHTWLIVPRSKLHKKKRTEGCRSGGIWISWLFSPQLTAPWEPITLWSTPPVKAAWWDPIKMKKGSWSVNFVPPGLTRSISTQEASLNAKVQAYRLGPRPAGFPVQLQWEKGFFVYHLVLSRLLHQKIN